jgi:hypothetical protein
MCYCQMNAIANRPKPNGACLLLRTPEGLGIDKGQEAADRANDDIAARAAALVDADLLEEHRRDPFGLHSDRLLRILHFVRRQPIVNKYVVVFSRDLGSWTVARMPGDLQEGEVVLFPEAQFATYAEAEHEIFRRRMEHLVEVHSAEGTPDS